MKMKISDWKSVVIVMVVLLALSIISCGSGGSTGTDGSGSSGSIDTGGSDDPGSPGGDPSSGDPAVVIAAFTCSPAAPFAGDPVQFTSKSTGDPASYEWAFGDGTASTAANPVHAFQNAGSYNVSLTVKKDAITNSMSQTIVVKEQAPGYFVDTNNSSANDSNPGTEALPWKTIARANQRLSAGDTVYIKAGTYNNEAINPVNSGTSDSARITYKNYKNDIVTIGNAVSTSTGLNLSGKSYVTVQGINFTGQNRFLYITNGAKHNIVAYCNFDNARLTNGAVATWAGSAVNYSSQYNWIHHCRFSKYGYFDSNDHSVVMDIGLEEDSQDQTRYNLIENNSFFHGGHHVVGVYGKYNVFRNNYFHNEPWSMGTSSSDRGAVLYGNRVLNFSGYSSNGGRNLFEGNRVAYSSDPSDNNGSNGIALNSSDNIIRYNTFVNNISAAVGLSLTSSYLQSIVGNKVYSNTFFNNGHNPYDPNDAMSSAVGLAIYSGSYVIRNNTFKNNLFSEHRIVVGEYNINTSDRKGLISQQTFLNNWDGDTQGDPQFVSADTRTNDPMNPAVPDLRLKSTSPCRDKGAYLAKITSATGSGTVISVDDAGYFFDGWGIPGVSGDTIQIFGTSTKANIVRVDYVSNAITLDRAVSWTQGQGISLPYSGSAPDAGAYETAVN